MGFASMFEEIMEALAGEVRDVMSPERQREASHRVSQASQLKAKRYDKPPKAFTKRVSHLLSEDGCPSYLIKYYINWTWQYVTGQKSTDQIWDEFTRKAIPLMTHHIKDDPITIAFVRKHLLKKGSSWVR
jgi:hypothetical protein